MLARKERLKRSDFNRFFASGKRYHSPFFTVVHTSYPTFHASVVVSKKVAAKAVVRNTLRRRVYHILRDVSREKASGGVFIVLTKKDALTATSAVLREAFAHVLGSIGKTR